MKIERKCIKCGIKQEKVKEKSNTNWEYYDCKVKCKCGGSFGIYLDGKLIGSDKS